MSNLQLTTGTKPDAVSSAVADAMSRMWQAVAVVDEIQAEVRLSIRQGDARAKCLDALSLAAVNLSTAAVAMLPLSIAQTVLAQRVG